MERRNWLWKRRSSSDKSPGETESSGSVSSHSERCSDDQDALRASPIDASPSHIQSPDVSSNTASCEINETVKSLNEKLSAALLNIKAKEGLVKQHAKVAEEAVSGWEKAEIEVAAVKQQLEAAAQKNSALEDRIDHLDGALKECVRQLRQSREEQEQKIHDAVINTTREWESAKSELESQLRELQAQLEDKNAVAATTIDHVLQLKVEALEKENFSLKVELFAQSDNLQKQKLERELSNCAAETASKQHLESIKKVTKLEAECRRLRAAARKSGAINDQKPLANSVCMESLTDSQSDSGERLFGIDNEPSCSDSWASALIAELDQFRNEKVLTRNVTAASMEIDLMEDFLEMERLAALPQTDHGSSSFELDADSDRALARDNPLKVELESVHQQMAELEERFEKMATEKTQMEMALGETKNQLKISCSQLKLAEDKLVELQRQINSANASKHISEIEVEAVEAKRKESESQLHLANLEIGKLQEKVDLLECKIEEEKALHTEIAAKYLSFEAVEAKKKELESQVESANFEIGKLHDKVTLLERKLEEEMTLSAEFATKCQNMEAIEAKSKDLESQLKSAHLEINDLVVKMILLEGNVREERVSSAEFAAKVEAMEAEKRALKSELELAELESGKLREKMGLLQMEVEDARTLSSAYSVKSQSLLAAEVKREELETQLSLSLQEVGKLHEKVSLLESQVDKENAFSAEVAALEERERTLESELKSAHSEVERFHKKVDFLERKIEERAFSAGYVDRYQNSEDELSRKRRETEFQHPPSSNGELNIRKEKELAESAGKLMECQKTIASLGRQLKSLATFEDFMLEAEEAELTNTLRSGDPLKNIFGSSIWKNGKELSTPSSSPSSLFGFEKLSPSRIDSHTENH